jgi:DedD protein
VGAIALVLFVVIVLPVVLDHDPRLVKHDLTVQIPSQDAGKFGARVLQKPEAAEIAEKSSRAAAPVEAPDKREPAGAEPNATDTPSKTPGKRAAEKGVKEAPSKTADSEAKRALALLNDESYVVPLGAFANPDNAKQIREKVAAAGFKTYTETIQSKEGEQTRVRAGPFESRESAEKARDKLKALGISVGQVAPR